MKIVVAANHLMRQFASSCVESAKKLGYSVVVYDLGGLGFGKPFKVDNPLFQEKGYYHEITKGRRAPGNHKIAVIRDCLNSYKELTVYLDADTLLLDKIDEMAGDYDIGLTVRPEWEVEKVVRNLIPSDYFIYDGYVNNGVMCFNPTEATYRFLELWEEKIAQLHADQGAINDILKEYFPLKSGEIIKARGIRIRTFDTRLYNHYYFRWPQIYKSYSVSENEIGIQWPAAKILHFKGRARSEYSNIFNLL